MSWEERGVEASSFILKKSCLQGYLKTHTKWPDHTLALGCGNNQVIMFTTLSKSASEKQREMIQKESEIIKHTNL